MTSLAERAKHTSMNDLPAVQIRKPIENTFGHLAQHFLPGSAAQFPDFPVDAVETAALTKLHCDGDCACGFVHERAVVSTNMF